MDKKRAAWLVYNLTSGSNDEVSLQRLIEGLDGAGFEVAGLMAFPEADAPSADDLRAAGIHHLAVFAGDGTLNSVVTDLFGWEGQVIVLPGGTKNLLSHRLHGDADQEEIVRRLGAGKGRIVRPTIIRSRLGVSLADVIAGPGAMWSDVREAARHADVLEFLSSAIDAIAASTDGPRVLYSEPCTGRAEGYPAINLVPTAAGLAGRGYHAETLADTARQGLAILKHDFRSGPHDDLGVHSVVRIASKEGAPIGLLLDGEPFDAGPSEEFTAASCEVDLLATAPLA